MGMGRNLMVVMGLWAGCGGGELGDGCPSVYDGEYNGILEYEWEDNTVNPPTMGSGQVKASVTFRCDSVSAGTARLSVTHAMLDDPYFACTLGGCAVDDLLSLAYFPASPPAIGLGKIAVYPQKGGAVTPGNFYTQSDVNVTGSGHIISSGPSGGDVTWYAFGGSTDFPGGTKTVVRWPRWTFSK